MSTKKVKPWNPKKDHMGMKESYGEVKDIRDREELDYNFDARDLKFEDKADLKLSKKQGK